MTSKLEWTERPVRSHPTTTNRIALFYEVKSRIHTYRVMLGLNERGRCELLEHLIHDEAATWFYPYRQLPYMRQRYERGDGAPEFKSLEDAMAHVEQQTHAWEASSTQ